MIDADEKNRINNAHWADLTYEEVSLIEDKEKKKEYRQKQRNVHLHIVNPLANSVPRNFKLSKPDNKLTYRMILSEYLNYFYSKGMTREEIIQMMVDNKTIKNGKKK